MFPLTIIIRGLENEPIDAVKIGASNIDGEKLYFIQTPDGRVCSVKENDVLAYWENTPSVEMLGQIDKMIEAGNALLRKKNENYKGAEVQ